MDRLQDLVRLHRMGTGGREVARLLGMCPSGPIGSGQTRSALVRAELRRRQDALSARRGAGGPGGVAAVRSVLSARNEGGAGQRAVRQVTPGIARWCSTSARRRASRSVSIARAQATGLRSLRGDCCRQALRAL